jgi:hypothetical protein
MTTLAGCTVEPVSYGEARALITEYEYLGTMNHVPAALYGLRAPSGELLGVSCFGRPGGTNALNVCGEPERTIALERGACVPWAPKDAASYLISRAVKLAHREHGWSAIVAYADPKAGELGTIYQALNWRYLGQGVGRRGDRFVWKRPGTDRWVDERQLRRAGFKGTGACARARAAGWESSTVPAKHKFVVFVGPDARRLESAALERLGLDEFPRAPRRQRAHRNRARARQKTRRGLTCGTCSTTLSALRATARYCSIRCRVRAYRSRTVTVTEAAS